jgi:hypothetical protein
VVLSQHHGGVSTATCDSDEPKWPTMVEAMSCSMRPTRGNEAQWKNGHNTLEGEAHREADNGSDDGFESGGLTGGFRRRFGPEARGLWGNVARLGARGKGARGNLFPWR